MARTDRKLAQLEESATRSTKSVAHLIKNRQTSELIIALCGAVGSGTSTIASKITEIFSDYNYEIHHIKLSELIERHIAIIRSELEKDKFLKEEYITKIDLSLEISKQDASDRIAILQSAGNILREKYSNDVLAQLAIKEIALKRDQEQNLEAATQKGESEISNENLRESRRHVTIIDSLKNPYEVELLRLVYQDMFYQFGVLCPEDIRLSRLVNQKKIKKVKATQLMDRDKSEGEKHGQQLLKTIYHSDFFITNTKENIDSLKPNLKRYIKIMMGDKTITPTLEENAMFHAQSASVKSGCLSRQVGASIMDQNGNLLSTGCNDVPKAGGGLYTIEDGENDSRCMFKYGGKCKNQQKRESIFADIENIIKKNLTGTDVKKVMTEIKENDSLNNLIEFCRAIHAEMDAITKVAKNGGVSLNGASLFTTTFPCHNCARHIIAAGISKIYYIEPYEKSLAIEMHNDALVFDNGGKGKSKKLSVELIPFEGVSPKKYLRLFTAENRKKDGARTEHERKTAKPALPVLLETRYEYESKIVENLAQIGLAT